MATTQKIPILFVDPGPSVALDSLAQTALKTGRWQFPAYATKSAFGIVKIPESLAGSPNPKIEVTIGGNALLGGASIDVATKVFADDAETYDFSLLVRDVIQDFPAPVKSKKTKKLTFTGGDLANVASGKFLWVEVRRLGGCGRLANEADIELIGASLNVDVVTVTGISDAELFAREAMRI